uniref:Uncharacterized protein n=1 Tax=Lotharella oceanica TaxID=641309 RepID=A0A7S2TGA3_9EUKA|mmetsp:Transcript_10184/g.19562  ORF Transcript_10184/g.19562 Transcript_10184/m.19562 type:complete len:203 (+) Transcript_10184:157-765(+)|eukprot:CAMPEP_0170191378 /NCGR_PEP_ID=MMETSP0040_2-20121228/51574_1 /TAXON_ID=641309 /ORGANISM="Lotharella oceanica, Strain CCMP622" /LENGTH=202 /DNA_ID=CAMNT_0010439447 /DNA_START=71 /DNA_END=679 /DNA_ORIENTATION=+
MFSQRQPPSVLATLRDDDRKFTSDDTKHTTYDAKQTRLNHGEHTSSVSSEAPSTTASNNFSCLLPERSNAMSHVSSDDDEEEEEDDVDIYITQGPTGLTLEWRDEFGHPQWLHVPKHVLDDIRQLYETTTTRRHAETSTEEEKDADGGNGRCHLDEGFEAAPRWNTCDDDYDEGGLYLFVDIVDFLVSAIAMHPLNYNDAHR